MDVSRRRFLQGAATGAGAVALPGAVIAAGAVHEAKGEGVAPPSSYPFYGTHQSGVLTPPPALRQNAASFIALDLITKDRKELAELLRTLAERASRLTAGGPPPDLGVGQPSSDSGVLGPVVPSDGLTVTVGVGASLFDSRFGLAERKPAKLTEMPVFPDDYLDPAWTHGDLMLQLCANNFDTVHHALRDLMRPIRGGAQIRWRIDGYNSPPRPSGTGRNLLGFKDGTANPVDKDAKSLVWSEGSEAGARWAEGGTYQVVRLIRMLVEFWDRVSINEQENMFGRRRDNGAPLDGNAEFDTPSYAGDPKGSVIPLDAHIRLANPRTSATDDQRLVRRSYNYDLGVDANGNMECGHIFVAFQQDVQRQFESVQKRLAGEPLVDYVQPFGGGYFYVLPGVRDKDDWYGRGLLG